MDALSLIFPKKCLECHKEGRYICGECLKKVRRVGWHSGNIYSIWKYEGIIRKATIALKYKYATQIAEEIVSNISLDKFPGKLYLVPIPLHWYRKNFRGFNQTEVLGESLAGKMHWHYVPDLLTRNKSALPQAQLKKSQRLTNVYSVFEVNPKVAIPRDSKIILFDDVATTGATLHEASQTLKKTGFKKIWCLTVAR